MDENIREARAVPGSPTANALKGAFAQDETFIARAPENQVVLSSRLEYLAREVGGCQTDQVLALVRRIMFEVISQRQLFSENPSKR